MAGDHRESLDRLRCQWDGEAGGWNDFLRRVRLAFEKTSRKKRHLLGPEVVGQLSGRAWVVTQEIDHRRLVRRDGVVYLLEFLREKLCETPIPDVGLRLEQLMLRLRRGPGVSMSTWAAQLRPSCRQLQIALARARRDQGVSQQPSSPTSTPSKPRSSRRQSRESEEEPHGEALIEADEVLETETVIEAPSDDGNPVASRTPASPSKSPTSPQRRRDRKDSDSDSSVKALEDMALWDRYEEKLEEALPSELLGWLLLRRAGLSAQGRLSVQAAAGNSLRLERVETAMRGMEEELLAHEAPRGPSQGPRRRTYWVEDMGQWSLLLADDEDMAEVLEGVGTRTVGTDPMVNMVCSDDFGYPDTWDASYEPNASYWGADGEVDEWEEDPTSYLTSEELQQVEEAYQVADGKLRSFVDARKAVKARHLSRGFYPFSPSSKGFHKGKGKSKGKGFGFGKGKYSKGSGSSPSSSPSMSMPILMNEGAAFAITPGQPGYSGCFICGDRNHQFRECPKRSSKGGSKGARPAMFLGGSETFMVEAEQERCPSDPSAPPHDEDPCVPSRPLLEDMVLAQDSLEDLSLDGFAVLDSGATETVSSLPALESLMRARHEVSGQQEVITVTSTPPERFKFGNGAHDMSASHILLPVTLGQKQVPMGVFTLDVQGVPLLIGIKTLRRLRAVLDCHHDVLVLGAVDPRRGVKLRRSPSGHLLLDLRRDLLVQSFSLTCPSSSFAALSKTSENYYSTGIGQVYMLSADEPQFSVQSSECVRAPAAPAVCGPLGAKPDKVLLASRDLETVPPPVDLGPEPSESDLMPSCRIILSLLALHGCRADCDSWRRSSFGGTCEELQFAGGDHRAATQDGSQAQGEEGSGLQVPASRLGSVSGGGCEGSPIQRAALQRGAPSSRILPGQPLGIEPVRPMGGVSNLQAAPQLHTASRMSCPSSSSRCFASGCGSCHQTRAAEPPDLEGQGDWLGSCREERRGQPKTKASPPGLRSETSSPQSPHTVIIDEAPETAMSTTPGRKAIRRQVETPEELEYAQRTA